MAQGVKFEIPLPRTFTHDPQNIRASLIDISPTDSESLGFDDDENVDTAWTDV